MKISEGVERGDLCRLLVNRIHIDEFRSKLGKDEDVSVVSFKISGKDPATDLVNFIEKGYNWVIDADVSSGEMDDGDYIVFVELERNKELPENVMTMLGDIMNLVLEDINDWKFLYYKDAVYQDLTVENLVKSVPLTREEYLKRYSKKDIDSLKNAAGVPVSTKAPDNELTDSIRIAAGIK